MWCVGLCVAEVGGPSAFRKGERKCLREAGSRAEPKCRVRLCGPCFSRVNLSGRVSGLAGSAGVEEDGRKAEVVGLWRRFPQKGGRCS